MLHKDHTFSEWPNNFKCSPYLQEKIVYVGQLETYEQSSELLKRLANVEVSDSSIFRMVNYYGRKIESTLYGAAPDKPESQLAADEVIYIQLDGSMIYTDDDWQEVKVGRIFKQSDCRESKVENRGNQIVKSEYAAYLGHYSNFVARFENLIEPYKRTNHQLVFISDGASWIKNWLKDNYADYPQILDIYHVCEHISRFAKEVFPRQYLKWFHTQKQLLLEAKPEQVIEQIKQLKLPDKQQQIQRSKLLKYLQGNLNRIQYAQFRKKGWYIGSGAIEAAHRTVVQKRMKLSGQRWSNQGAAHLLNLRVCYMSHKWNLVLNNILNKKIA